MRIDLQQLVIDTINQFPTQQKAADWFGYSQNTINSILLKKSQPTTTVCQLALDAFFSHRGVSDFDVRQGAILLLMPILRHVEGKTHASLNRALADFGRDKISELHQFGTDIDRARCILADRAMLTTSEWFVFMDADAIVPCGYGPFLRQLGYEIPDPNASLNAFARLMSAPAEQRILSALCFARREPLVAACSSGVGGGINAVDLVRRRNEPGETGTEPQDWVGMHFCRIHRSVFEEMRAKADEHFPEIKPRHPTHPWGYFIKEHAAQSEDGVFCQRAKKIGIQAYVDTALRVGHVTNKII